MSQTNPFTGVLDEFFKRGSAARDEKTAAFQQGVVKGFEICKAHVARLLEEEGKGITAARVRKLTLAKKP